MNTYSVQYSRDGEWLNTFRDDTDIDAALKWARENVQPTGGLCVSLHVSQAEMQEAIDNNPTFGEWSEERLQQRLLRATWRQALRVT